MTRLQVDVELSVRKSLDSRDEPTVSLQVTDRKSSTVIVQIELTPGQVLGALSGSYLSDLEAFFTPVPERIGKKMVHRQIDVPRHVTDGLPYSRSEGYKAHEEAVRRWAVGLADDGETVEPRNTNQGWKVVFRSYVEEV